MRWRDDAIASEVASFVLKLVKAKSETNFLEPGVGTGLNILPFVQRGYSVTGIDMSAEMLDQLQKKAGDQCSNLTLIRGDASTLPLADSSFDVVIAAHMSHGVSGLETFAGEIHRVLKSGGFFLSAQWLLPSARLKFENQFRAIAANHTKKIESFRQSERFVDDVKLSHHLIKRGYEERYFKVKEWVVKNSVGELLENIQSKAYGYCWRLEEEAFKEVVEEFTAFCLEHYGSLTEEILSQAKYEIWSYQKPVP
ncbi:MAG: class I SAM-dependent methyltransferase [Cyanobacteria bacterium P01_D01_bin.73]